MKILILLLTVLLLSASCKKEEKEGTLPQILLKITKNIILPVVDTIPNDATLKIKLCKDSSNTDETDIIFDRSASIKFSYSEDALYFAGFGQVSLASISGDGKDLAINNLPYTPGMSIGLYFKTKTDGAYLLKVSYENAIPPHVQVWLRDNYLKDSVDICKGNYNFNVIKADTTSFGKSRFNIVLKDSRF